MKQNPNLVRGTLDLLILKSLTWEPKHGYAVSEWIEAVTDGTVLMEEGTLYPALHRLHAKGWIESEWGVSENNRRAKYYSMTPAGVTRLARESDSWARFTSVVAQALAVDTPDP